MITLIIVIYGIISLSLGYFIGSCEHTKSYLMGFRHGHLKDLRIIKKTPSTLLEEYGISYKETE